MYYRNPFTDDTLGYSPGEVELREFFFRNSESLGCAAAFISGRRGRRLVDALREGLGQPGPLTRRMRGLFLDLRDILFLDVSHRNPDGDFGSLNMLEPEDPALADICLLSEGLSDAMSAAGIIPDLDEPSI